MHWPLAVKIFQFVEHKQESLATTVVGLQDYQISQMVALANDVYLVKVGLFKLKTDLLGRHFSLRQAVYQDSSKNTKYRIFFSFSFSTGTAKYNIFSLLPRSIMC